MVFYDFEVTKFDWLVVCIDPSQQTVTKIINNTSELLDYYTEHKEDIWIGYNNRHYDQYILKGLLSGQNAYEISKWIVFDGKPGWKYSESMREIFMINFDVSIFGRSLKELEAFQGHSIYESNVPFDIDRPMTAAEIKEMTDYCVNDVIETMNIFRENINEFNALMWLVKEFKFPLSYLGKTKAQISAEILECTPQKRSDEWDLKILDCISLNKYHHIKQWFLTHLDYSEELVTEVAGVEHHFSWGGIHGAIPQYHYKCDRSHIMLHVDVASYYPRLMIFHNLLTRNAKHPERFKSIFDERIRLKRAGKKKEQAPLKIVINGTFGITKDKNNKAYDPLMANLICVNGQLMLLDLIEKLEPVAELIQSNTDGLIIKIKRSDFSKVDDICYEWEQRCNMELEFDYIKEIFQKDVNNYIFLGYEGEVERKGAYVKELNPLDNDLPIVNEALFNYMVKGIPVEVTINNCNKLMKFQKVCKLTKNYDHVEWIRNELVNGFGKSYTYTNKCYRIFASTDPTDGKVYKVKGNHYDKFANTSELSFIENGDITLATVPGRLDRNFYIDLAKRRLEQYGVF